MYVCGMKKFFVLLWAAMTLMPISVSAAQKEKAPATVSVISYNIRHGKANDGTNSWQFRYHTSAMMLTDQAPDLMGVQEAYDFQIKYIKEFTKGYNYIGVGRDDGKSKGEQMGIFYNSKTIKVLKWGTYWLSETPDVPSFGWDAKCRRSATWALLKDKRSGKKFFYVNTHLDHVGVEARSKGLQLVQNKIAEMNPKGWPLILSGDFNIEPDNEAILQLDKSMKSARDVAAKTDRHGSFNGWGKTNPETIIDYIYFSGFSRCERFETITKEYDGRKFISDHYPIKAVLVF